MAKLTILATLLYDDDIMHSKDRDSEGKDWFMNLLLTEPLVVHSNEIGDMIGVLKIESFVTDV